MLVFKASDLFLFPFPTSMRSHCTKRSEQSGAQLRERQAAVVRQGMPPDSHDAGMGSTVMAKGV